MSLFRAAIDHVNLTDLADLPDLTNQIDLTTKDFGCFGPEGVSHGWADRLDGPAGVTSTTTGTTRNKGASEHTALDRAIEALTARTQVGAAARERSRERRSDLGGQIQTIASRTQPKAEQS